MKNLLESVKTDIVAASLAIGLLMLATGRIEAQRIPVSLALTVTYQNPNVKQSANADITTTGTESASVTLAAIQTLISNNLGMSLKGYNLIYDIGSSNFEETNSRTGDVQDISSIFDVNIDVSGSRDFVTSGTSDPTDPIAQSFIATSEMNFTFDDGNGNSFNVSGLVKLTETLNSLSASQINNGDSQTETVSFTGSVSGYGTVVDKKGNQDNAVFSGTVSGSGKGPEGS